MSLFLSCSSHSSADDLLVARISRLTNGTHKKAHRCCRVTSMSPRIAAPRAISSNCDSFAECSALPQADLRPSISTPEALGFPHFTTTEIEPANHRGVGYIPQSEMRISSRGYQRRYRLRFDWPKNHSPDYWASEAQGTAVSALHRCKHFCW